MKSLLPVLAFIFMIGFTLASGAHSVTGLLKSGDTLSIVVHGEPDTNINIRKAVITDGKIDLPRLGRVPAEGLTLQEFYRIVEGQYSKLLKDPQITVSLRIF
jgi:protein involved in polysaccharide export with SLBB domain